MSSLDFLKELYRVWGEFWGTKHGFDQLSFGYNVALLARECGNNLGELPSIGFIYRFYFAKWGAISAILLPGGASWRR